MSKDLERARPRLLLICKNAGSRNDLVTLLTGYGYFVDYVDSRASGIINFKEHKQTIVILDVPALPQFPEKMLKLFTLYKRHPILLIAVQKDEEAAVYPYMKLGVFDIVQLPLKPDYQHYVLKRLVEHSNLIAQNEFMRMMLHLLVWGIPLWITAILFIVK